MHLVLNLSKIAKSTSSCRSCKSILSFFFLEKIKKMNVENKEILHNPWFHTEIICLYLIVHLELFCLAILSRLRCRSFFRPDGRSAGFFKGSGKFPRNSYAVCYCPRRVVLPQSSKIRGMKLLR